LLTADFRGVTSEALVLRGPARYNFLHILCHPSASAASHPTLNRTKITLFPSWPQTTAAHSPKRPLSPQRPCPGAGRQPTPHPPHSAATGSPGRHRRLSGRGPNHGVTGEAKYPLQLPAMVAARMHTRGWCACLPGSAPSSNPDKVRAGGGWNHKEPSHRPSSRAVGAATAGARRVGRSEPVRVGPLHVDRSGERRLIDRMRQGSIVGSVGPLHGPGRQRSDTSAGQPDRPEGEDQAGPTTSHLGPCRRRTFRRTNQMCSTNSLRLRRRHHRLPGIHRRRHSDHRAATLRGNGPVSGPLAGRA
jgi:hypothetical protein